MTVNNRQIAVFTGSRAEYGLLSPVIRALQDDPRIKTSLLLAGSHSKDSAGNFSSAAEVSQDGFPITAILKHELATNDLAATASSIGQLIVLAVAELKKINPQILVVYGDRSEAFAAAIAASQMGIVLAHIEAGDRTDGGCLDDSVRHAISKLSHLFFTTNQEATSRIKQLGEEDWRIHTVGLATLDLIKKGDFSSVSDLQNEFGLTASKPLILFTQHSVALELEQINSQIETSLAALDDLISEGNQIVITAANLDAGGEIINNKLAVFVKKHSASVIFVPSLGRRRYHGFLNWCVSAETAGGACVGNSSSGLKEAIAFGCPAVNIGQRQAGRLSPKNVLNVAHDTAQIVTNVNLALKDKTFRENCKRCPNPYGTGNSGKLIADVLASVDLDAAKRKKFVDLVNVVGKSAEG